jgi:hypothetical protein
MLQSKANQSPLPACSRKTTRHTRHDRDTVQAPPHFFAPLPSACILLGARCAMEQLCPKYQHFRQVWITFQVCSAAPHSSCNVTAVRIATGCANCTAARDACSQNHSRDTWSTQTSCTTEHMMSRMVVALLGGNEGGAAYNEQDSCGPVRRE